MKLKQIKAKGFRSYKKEQTLDLSDVPPGFYHVCGANGAGKSTLFDVFHWTLFGETSRGLRASAVNSWGAKKGCETSLVLDDAEISRGWSPNYLRVDGDEVDQEQLQQALQLTPEVALNTVYFSQFADFFLDLKPPQRMELYSTVLGLDLWEEKSELASKLAKEYGTTAQALEVEEAKLRERASTLLSVDYRSAIKAWEQDKAERLTKIALQGEAAVARLKILTKEKQAVQQRIEPALKKAAADNEASRKAGEERTAAKAKLDTAKVNERVAQLKLAEVRRALKAFDGLDVDHCPSCGQQVSAGHMIKHRKALLGAIEVESVAEEVCARDAVKAARQLIAAEGKWDKADPSKADNELASLRKALERVEDKLAGEQERMDKLIERYKEEQAQPNPFELQKSKDKALAAEATKVADAKAKELSDVRYLASAFSFWTKGFKDVRFQVMQESLAQLNVEVNECLHDLGLQGWQLQFDVEHETKKGTVKRGFQCSVMSPSSVEGVPWEAWSGGESQRLRVAAQMGVSNMICSRLGIDPDFEFWDEPSTYLNEEGIKDMLAVLQERAHRYQRRIFLADHRSLDFDFDGTLYINNTEEGSTIKPSWN